MSENIKQAAAELATFEKSGGADHLEKAVELLEEVDVLAIRQHANREAARVDLLRAWCGALTVLDRVKDPKFNPDDAPLLNIAPPESNSKEEMRLHRMAVEANEAKKPMRRTQFLVRNLEERVIESARRHIEKFFTKSAADRNEIKAVFVNAKLTKEQQAALLGR